MKVSISRLASAGAVFVAMLVAVPMAPAEIGPIQLVSKTAGEQALEAGETALSANGRYLAFSGSIGGLKGVFRKDLQTGAVEPVAVKSSLEGGGGVESPAPSISADGRYISFTTGARLDEDDDPSKGTADVYVADMAVSPPTYELASALDGCDPASPLPHSPCGLEYQGGGSGSEASGRVALSADGRKVAFFTMADSNLTSEPGGGTEGVPTPLGQVALRDLATDRTTLVSVERDSETGAMTDRPVLGGAVLNRALIKTSLLERLPGAALSADGTTVAWLGTHLPSQVPLLGDERKVIEQRDTENGGLTPYLEPLWRRVADGVLAPTRRIIGGGDPSAPGCPVGGTLSDPACQGPFLHLADSKQEVNPAGSTGWLGAAHANGTPQLSADGKTVALIGNPIGATNLYLVDMSGGLTRRQAVRELTREVPVSSTDPTQGINTLPNIPRNGHIYDLAISADGERIALATARQQFPLTPPSLVGPQPSSLGLVELYLIDRDGETLRLVTHGDGSATEASLTTNSQGLRQTAVDGLGATTPSFDADGSLLAFASDASNLVEGDGNNAKDAFLVDVAAASRAVGPSGISPSPRKRRIKRRWHLTLSAYSLPNGRVRLVAVVPARGKLSAGAWGKLDPEARAHRLAGAAKRARKRSGGPVKLTLGLPRPLRHLAHAPDGIFAMAHVSFRHGHRVLRGELQVRFHAHPRRPGRLP